MLSDAKIRFSQTVADALDILDEDELQEVTDELARDEEDF